MAVASLSQTIASVQASQLRDSQIKKEYEMGTRLGVPAPEPLTRPEHELLAVFIMWCEQRGVRYLPATPSVIATFVQEIAHRGDDFILAVLSAIRRGHTNLNTADPTASRPVWFILEKILKADLPPRSWPAIEKTLWATLPAETRKIITRREAERENDIRNKQNELSAAIKAAEQRQTDGAETKPVNIEKENEMAKKKNHEVLGKYTDNKPGITRIKTPGDTPGPGYLEGAGPKSVGRLGGTDSASVLE